MGTTPGDDRLLPGRVRLALLATRKVEALMSARTAEPVASPGAGRQDWEPLPRRPDRPGRLRGRRPGSGSGPPGANPSGGKDRFAAEGRSGGKGRSGGQGPSARARWGLRAASVLFPLALWAAVSTAEVVDPTFLPSPLAVLEAFAEMLGTGQLVDDTLASLGRVGAGFGLAVLISVPLGVAMGTSAVALALLEPVVGLLRYMPAAAFIPLLIIWLGLGEPSKIAILVLGVVFFNTLMVADAVRRVPGELGQAAATLGARRGEILRKVTWPYALPAVVDAARINAAAAWNFVVVAELVAAESGLGYRIVRAQRFLQTDKIFAVLIVIGVVGLLIDVALRVLRDRLGRWVV
ncbi:ABC transporter permease [Streptosporangium sp. NPDC023963]|uniref:ABC transporter permease n=1 Tax=Streptosporangium sp. NPDC023963 TaxID=3155608 RepID=UPI00343436C8